MIPTTLFLVSFLLPQTTHALTSLRIPTTSGQILGSIDPATPSVAQFLGIPYAEPPTGPRRWLPAVRKSQSPGFVFDASKFGPACPQYHSSAPTTWLVDAPEFHTQPEDFQDEDCLSVNIWMPWEKERKGDEELLPVVVWIHGGSFQTGTLCCWRSMCWLVD